MQKLSGKEIQDRLKKLKSWILKDETLHKSYAFKDFREAMAFVTRVSLAAEAMDHHPDILIQYDKVALTASTHSAGGITEKDFELAEQIDAT